jgi:alkylated DNA nucleotide flippase Atl1
MSSEDQSVRQFLISDIKDGAPQEVASTTFSDIGAKERQDIQRWIKQTPEILGEDIMIIGEEISSWTKSKDRPDLLGIDASGKLVVVEIKRDSSDPNHHLQVLRYASYVSTLSVDQVIEVFAAFRQEEGLGDASEAEAGEILAEFTNGALAEIDDDEQPRMILAAAQYRPEVMSTVLWLRKFGLDIGCVRLEPFEIDNRVVLSATTLVPLPEANDYEIGLQTKRKSASSKKRPIDRDRALAFIASIPDGKWTGYKDVAAAGGNPKAAMGVGYMLSKIAIGESPLVYRVLKVNGEVSPGWAAEDPSLPQTTADVEDKLRAEGVTFNEGRASANDRWRVEDWK